jgi:hypothetical protein
MRPLDIGRIEAAMGVIDPVFLHSPLMAETSLDRVLGAAAVQGREPQSDPLVQGPWHGPVPPPA